MKWDRELFTGYYAGRKYIQTKSYGRQPFIKLLKKMAMLFGVFGTKVLDDRMDNVETGMAMQLGWVK